MKVFRAGLIAALAMGLLVSAARAQDETSEQAKPADAFGTEIMLPDRAVVFMSGNGKWDTAFDTLVDAFKTVYGFMEKTGLQPAGNPLMIYTGADDSGFSFQAAVPIDAAPDNPPQGDIAIGQSPSGRAHKFVHRGSYDGMENTYEAITNFFEEKNIEPKDMFIEEYMTDPRSTPEGELVINVMVPVK